MKASIFVAAALVLAASTSAANVSERRLAAVVKPIAAPLATPLKPVTGGLKPGLPIEDAQQQDPLSLQPVLAPSGQVNPVKGLVDTLGVRSSNAGEKRLAAVIKPVAAPITAPLKPVTGGITPGLPIEDAKQQDPLSLQPVLAPSGQVNPIKGLVDTLGVRSNAGEKRLVDTLKPVLQGLTKPLKPLTDPLTGVLPLENAEQQDPLGLQQVLVVDGEFNPLGGLVKTLGLRDAAPEKRLVDTLKPVLQGVTKPLKPLTEPVVAILPAENAEQQDPLGLQQVLVTEGQVNPLGGLVKTLGLRDVAPEKRLVEVLEPVLKAVTNPLDQLVPALQAGQVVHNVLGVVQDLVPDKYAPAPAARAEKAECLDSKKVVQSES